ncbi:3-phosphoshikimate 1-carboxyvinyltransferase [Membranihabitans maritimus]|uniref:3-phosphoshikimate 1-carboxyvinyltransferase n=1 Tax=Membranihabitans maritimus TaxID=2904244 RepID=UPI001F2CCFBF|nr:3-phosphoshikimate 1-carboxyvinyltransferase [Membranihabitans maritimus]
MEKKIITVHKKNKSARGTIKLDGSKSISNRVLIIRALTSSPFKIHNLSTSDDTVALNRILSTDKDIYNTGAAGTTFRFLTAYLSTQDKKCTLTGSERMKQRPIGGLVDPLRELGANIQYLEKDGYPPLQFEPGILDATNKLSVKSNISSQFITALLLIAPTLPNGLEIDLEGDMVSRSYIELTLHIMKDFGIQYKWEGSLISIPHQEYIAKEYTVESDWSAASYYYSIAALADDSEIELKGLFDNSFQGDSAAVDLYKNFGIRTIFNDDGITIQKSGEIAPVFEHDFILCPDIAQTIAVTCAGTGTEGLFTGLQTLSIKETDRITALQNELGKMDVSFVKMPPKFSSKSGKEYYMINGQAKFPETITFPTYEDHRMAMAFAPLAILHPIRVEEPKVVGKSYPEFWKDLKLLGFEINE